MLLSHEGRRNWSRNSKGNVTKHAKNQKEGENVQNILHRHNTVDFI